MEANKDFLTLFLVIDKIKQNANNNKSPPYYGVSDLVTFMVSGILYNCYYILQKCGSRRNLCRKSLPFLK